MYLLISTTGPSVQQIKDSKHEKILNTNWIQMQVLTKHFQLLIKKILPFSKFFKWKKKTLIQKKNNSKSCSIPMNMSLLKLPSPQPLSLPLANHRLGHRVNSRRVSSSPSCMTSCSIGGVACNVVIVHKRQKTCDSPNPVADPEGGGEGVRPPKVALRWGKAQVTFRNRSVSPELSVAQKWQTTFWKHQSINNSNILV